MIPARSSRRVFATGTRLRHLPACAQAELDRTAARYGDTAYIYAAGYRDGYHDHFPGPSHYRPITAHFDTYAEGYDAGASRAEFDAQWRRA